MLEIKIKWLYTHYLIPKKLTVKAKIKNACKREKLKKKNKGKC